jgi:hypothetical protein
LANNSDIAAKIGCALENEQQVTIAYLPFQNGFMFYRQDTTQIWVFYNQTGKWEVYSDTWKSGEPPVSAPAGLYVPMYGFGKIWYYNQLQAKLGWATQPNQYSSSLAAAEKFEQGLLLSNPGGDIAGGKRIYVLYSDTSFLNKPDLNNS